MDLAGVRESMEKVVQAVQSEIKERQEALLAWPETRFGDTIQGRQKVTTPPGT